MIAFDDYAAHDGMGLAGLVQAARSKGVVTALDNTWGAGVAFRPFDLGIDIVMQALTKALG